MEITVKQATSEDVQVLSKIAQLTFPLAGPANANKQELSTYIKQHLNESVFQQLVESDEVFVACALAGTALVGFIVMKYASAQPNGDKSVNSAELQRLYVLKEYHGENVAKLLLLEAFKACAEKAIAAIWLNVYSENSRAKNFYAKFGFKEAGTIDFKMGNETHLDTVMVANITTE